MASLIKKKIGKHSYWYARECAWVEGRPKIVWQKYLGKADAIVEAMADKPKAPSPKRVVIAEFGAVAACFAMSQRIQLRKIIDRHAPKRNQGLSVGTYMELATINRVVAPTSTSRPTTMTMVIRVRRFILRLLIGSSVEVRDYWSAGSSCSGWTLAASVIVSSPLTGPS